MPQTLLERTTFETSRAAEYFTVRELQAQTGQPRERFAAVALKELVDNALDACETAGIAPSIGIEIAMEPTVMQMTVADNGAGITPETVRRILHFQTRTSDKAVYRSPTRGAQGNALKTVLGLPCALGLREPVLIEAQGVRHRILAWIDPAGELRLQYDEEVIPATPGTRITLPVPADGQDFDPPCWARAFALFNPHASVKIRMSRSGSQHAHSRLDHPGDVYQATIAFPGGWRKCLPSDPTSAWWYDVADLKRLVFAHIAEARRGGQDLLLRDFVKQFRNLSANAKAKAVCAALPSIKRLTDFEADEEAVDRLLEVMRCEAKAPSPEILGAMGEAHVRACFETWYGVKRWWYRKVAGDVHGIPFIVEAAVAETARPGWLWTGVNFSPTFEDPLAATLLLAPKVSAYGLRNFLKSAHVVPIPDPWDETPTQTAVAVHVVCPVFEFLDRGKTRLKLPPAMAEQIATALWHVVKDLYQAEERRRKDAARADRMTRERERAQGSKRSWSQKDAVFQVLPEALARATGHGVFAVSSRTLYYQVRPLIQPLTDKELEYDYFSQDLLTQYRNIYGPITGLYYDPRGVLYEPHTGHTLQLGTREVEAYQFPAWLYDKILYVEKKGLWPILQAARLADRYDMAVIGAEGYATEATRILFAQAEKGRNYQLFVLHDADPYGYNIARTLREETDRMPGYHVDVIDLGLHLEEGLGMDLGVETFTRKQALPAGLVLTETAREYFEGRRVGEKSWLCRRIELNAFSAPALVTYIEQTLQRVGVRGKVIPPDDVLPRLAREAYRQQMDAWVDHTLSALVSLQAIKVSLAEIFERRVPFAEARAWIEQACAGDATLSWRDALDTKLRALVGEVADEAEAALRKVIDSLAPHR
jgi:DNA topoisomerase 6 subunit A-like protein/histidine kinase/DNA gyrase B/HSP90-like ATPase